jgi:protein-S-isoprenylcysteine O-methyltransferase Ste14
MAHETLTKASTGFPLRLYPPLWFLIFALSAVALARLLPMTIDLPLPTTAVALGLLLGGGILASWAALLFKRHRTTVHPYAEASRLVTRGPYRVTRNPMYVGLLMTLVALGLWQQSLSALALAPLFVFVINRCNILPEERRLTALFGDEYRVYRMRTRRWLW